jgi:hypothetical protein
LGKLLFSKVCFDLTIIFCAILSLPKGQDIAFGLRNHGTRDVYVRGGTTMAKTLTLKSLNARMDTLEAKLDRIADLLERKPEPARGDVQPKVEKVEYTKADGTKVMATPSQVAAWDAWKANAGTRKENSEKFEQMKADWADKRDAYKPSKALIKAIKANRAAVTHAEAKKLGFVGTKQDLQALKAELCK